MLGELTLRFIVGGLIVCFFAVIGDILRPKSFAGIFGAAPSVALASLSVTFINKGGAEAARAGQSMVIGAIALFFYCFVVHWLLNQQGWQVRAAVTSSWLLWLAVALGGWATFLA